jgi:hypothetical protein
MNPFCFYLFQINCFNFVLMTYGDTKICDLKTGFSAHFCMIYESDKDYLLSYRLFVLQNSL